MARKGWIKKPNRDEVRRSFWQSLVIAICLLLCLLLMHFSINGLVITCLAASCFVAFAFPAAESGRNRYLVGGYICGALIGAAFGYIRIWLAPMVGEFPIGLTLCVPAVFFTAFFMLIFDFEHPPATPLAVSLVIDGQPFVTALIALGCIFIICGVRYIMTRFKLWPGAGELPKA